MKKLIIPVAMLILASCGGETKSKVEKTTEDIKTEVKIEKKAAEKVVKEEVVAVASSGFDSEKANALFVEKTCITCHQAATKTVGPSMQTIAAAYAGKEADMLSFLQGKGEVIVDPAMAAVMQATIDNITSTMEEDELKLLVDFVMSHK